MNCNLPLTSDFKSDVESLPERFLFSDEVNRKAASKRCPNVIAMMTKSIERAFYRVVQRN